MLLLLLMLEALVKDMFMKDEDIRKGIEDGSYTFETDSRSNQVHVYVVRGHERIQRGHGLPYPLNGGLGKQIANARKGRATLSRT